jgi:ATP-dependent Lon protease
MAPPQAGRKRTRKQNPDPDAAHELPEVADEFPILPLRDVVVYPHMVIPLGVVRDRTVRAVQAAKLEGRPLFAVAQTDLHVDDPWPSDLHDMGTVARAVQVIELPDGTLRVLLEGMYRARLVSVPQREPYFVARVERVETQEARSREMQAMMRNVVSQFEEATNLSRSIPPEALVSALNIDEPGRLADLVATYLSLKLADKQDLLETLDATRRLRKLDLLLAGELELLKLERDIHARVHDELEDSQREHYLREQLKAIQDELGDSYGMGDDLDEYRERVLTSGMSPEASDKALREIDRLAQMPQASPEVSVIRTYLDWLLELPWTTATQDEIDIARAMDILNEDHYGLKKVKERVLEFLAVRQLVRDVRGPILCFVGPPGVGKTSIGRSIARAMGREFIRVSLGGVHDEAEIRGHRRTYVGALPGRIIQALRRARSNNPVFMIDEIDKIGADFRGDPTSALLEVLDPEQNNSFRDHYLEVAFDLSQVMFVATGNFLASIPPALRDRMEIIEFSGYTEDEKLQIAQRFLVAKQRKEHGVTGKHIRFTAGGLRHLITHYTYEAGVRNLEREVAALCRKVATRVAGGEKPSVKVTPEAIGEMRGPEVYRHDRRLTQDRIGIATGLSYTPAGGDVIHIEVSIVPGKGELLLTGQLGDVMRESAQAALGYARLAGEGWGLPEDYFGKHDIHVHVPSGAIPKEGPSAGIAICTALVSGLRQLPVRSAVAMTGEITLHGRVLPIGGVREKVLAAHRAGISKVILPVDNERDLHDQDEIPAQVRQEMGFVFVETMDQVMAEALAG